MARTCLAAEGALMKSNEPTPPRWAEALLRSLVKPSDRESISGDLLEEYREVRRPALGAVRANAWYGKHVFSVLWFRIWPCALAMAGMSLVSLAVMRIPWNVSLVPAPRVSLLDALIYLWAGYQGSRRSGLIKTGIVSAGATAFIGFVVTFTSFAIEDPSLLIAPFSKPFIFVILSLLMLLALIAGVVVGAAGGVIGKWLTPAASRTIRAS